MEFSALMTSAGINIGLCAIFLSLYSILRKQPGNASVYFGRKLAQEHNRQNGCHFSMERLFPSPSWIFKAWEFTEGDILQCAGIDAVVFLRILVFSIRVFAVASTVCIIGVLPVNYFGKEMLHKQIPSEPLEVFTIANVKQGSRWLWVHCLALYIITLTSICLLHHEYKNIARMRLAHITKSPPNPSHFTVLLRSIPKSRDQFLGDTISNFFANYHGGSYLSHQVIYRTGEVQKLMSRAESMYRKFVRLNPSACGHNRRPSLYRCGLCGCHRPTSFHLYKTDPDLDLESNSINLGRSSIYLQQKDCLAAFVFFKTRYAARIASKIVQSGNPMLWVTDEAPMPHDVYWRNLSIPYKQLWLRRIITLISSIVFMLFFLVPVTFVQGLTQLEQMRRLFPFFKDLLEKPFVTKVVTGYLPSVILLIFFYTVPPVMMLFSTIEGSISRSARKTSTCFKVTFFTIWNIFFVTVFSGTWISRLNEITRPNDMPSHLAEAVPKQATLFITYVFTSGWAGLCSEILQVYPLIYHFIRRYVLRKIDEPDPKLVPSFPYHTEVPKVLLFGLLGFTCSILAPLILPILMSYFFLAYLIYRNQILNVYCLRYETGGKMWPLVHNTTVFSLVLMQIIALGVFGIKHSKLSSVLTIPLVICTLLFNQYTRQRFLPIFMSLSAQDLIEMDRDDEVSGRMEEIHQQLLTAYSQIPSIDKESNEEIVDDEEENGMYGKEDVSSTVADPNPLSSSISQEIKPIRGNLDKS